MSIKLINIILLLPVILTACRSGEKSFNEENWQKTVAGTDREKLYADHYRDGRYFNPWLPMGSKGFRNLLKWKLTADPEYTEEEEQYLPEFIPDAYERIIKSGNRDLVVWIGHNTFLLRIHGTYWITDPMFSTRALLPKRKLPPALTTSELNALAPRINVIISHNHYDHLDKKSVKAMPGSSRFFVPVGMKKLLAEWTQGTVQELDWWQSVNCGNGFTLTCLPAQHWSKRINRGTNKTLWASFLLSGRDLKIYFGGDSGYFRGYSEFGKKFSSIDYAFIPVTAYHPRWFMHYAHINADEALKAFSDLGAGYMIPTQWGTFRLGDNPAGYPALDLKNKIRERKLDPSKIIIMDIGEIVFLKNRSVKAVR